MPDIISHADHIRNITEMRIQLIPKFHRLKQNYKTWKCLQ